MNEVGNYIAVLVAALLGLCLLTAPSWDEFIHAWPVWVMGGYLGLCVVTHKRQ